MKKSILFFFFTSLCFAGGNIEPVITNISEPSEVYKTVNENGFYIGVGLTNMSLDNDLTQEEFTATGAMILAGYQYNQYLAIEGRYTRDISDVEYKQGRTNNPDYKDYPTDFSNIAVYIKPIYPIGNFSIYGLLGYGEVTLNNLPLGDTSVSADRAEDGLQWGVGASYSLTNNILFFIDYVQMYDDQGFDYRAMDVDITSDAYTFGINYKF